ncbi:hypothetical protein ACROYT_G016969 [Oculina patagonica]
MFKISAVSTTMANSNFNLSQNFPPKNDQLENAVAEPGVEYFAFAPALGIVMLLAIFGNITLIVTICRNPGLRTLTNMFILNQACADLGVALLCMPFSIITCFTRDWIFGDSLCQLNGFMNILFEASSLFTLTAISIEKYFSIVKPMTVVITTRLALTMVAMTWLTALALATIPLTGFIAFEFKTGSTQCGVQIPETAGQTVYASAILLVAFLVPLCIMGFCYINIFKVAKQHNIRLSRTSISSIESESLLTSQNQIALTIFILLIVFIICWTPFFSYMMYMSINHIKNPDAFAQSFGQASYWFVFLNSSINPFVYGIRNPLIRKELYSMCCRRFQYGKRRSSLEKAHGSDLDSSPGSPQPFTGCDKSSPVYPAYINAVALSEEDIASPYEGIGKLTSDRGTQTGQDWQILSVQDLPRKIYTYTDSAIEVTCSTCSSTCSESDHVMISGSEKVTCSSESEVDSLCGESRHVVQIVRRSIFDSLIISPFSARGHYHNMDANDSLTNTTNMQDNNTTSEPTMAMYSELEHILMSGSLLLIMLATLVGNGTVCLAVYRRRKLRTRTNMFIINLSCADIGVAVLCMPFSLYTCLRHGWVLGDALCKLNGFLNIVFCLTSLLTLTAISVETYFAICKPLYHRHMSRKFALGLLLWTWIQPIVIACVPFFGIMEYEFKPGTTQCGVQFPSNVAEKVYATLVILCGFIIPLSIMGFTYSNIFRSARRYARRASRVSFSSTTSINSTTAHRQVAVTVLILLVVFLFCWLPYFLYAVLVSLENPTLSTDYRVMALGKAAYWCAFASSALNPYIYGFRNPQFRKEFQFLLCWLCPCVRRGLRMRGCSTTTGSRGSWDGSGFEYNHLKRPSLPLGSPKGRGLSVEFAPFPPEQMAKLEMLALKAKLSNCSSDPGYCSQEDNGGFNAETGGTDEGVVIENNNNNSNTSQVLNTESQDKFMEILSNEDNLQCSASDQQPLTEERPTSGSNSNQGFVFESIPENSAERALNEHENETEISRSQAEPSVEPSPPREMLLSTSPTEVLLTPTRPRGWSLRTLGARLKLGWVESSL